MNARGAKSVQSIMENVLHKPPKGLLYFAIFGSQVRGDEREDSDLDMLYVTSACNSSLGSDLRRAATISGGVEMVTIISCTPDELVKNANLYGTVEYRAMREPSMKVLYQSDGFTVKLDPGVDYGRATSYWLETTRTYVFPAKDYSKLLPGTTCFKTYLAVDSLLRASLMSLRTEFPFTHDLHVLYGMLPPEMRPPVDISAVMTMWKKYLAIGNNSSDWSPDDVRKAKETAKRAYKFTIGLIERRNTLVS